MWVDSIISFIEGVGPWGYAIAFFAALLESLAFVGFLIPGSIVITLLGFAASKGDMHPVVLIILSIIGAITGDIISYYFGRNGTHVFTDTNRIFHTRHLERGKTFFEKHGYYSVFLGRFVGAIRAFIPYIAGIFRMDIKTFLLWDIASAIAWAVSHVYIGYFFGAAWKVAEKWSTRAGLFLIVAILFFGLLWWTTRFLGRRAKRIGRFMRSVGQSIVIAIRTNEDVIRWAAQHPKSAAFIRNRTSIRSFWGLPFTLFVVVFLYALLEFFGIVQGVVATGVLAGADVRVENLLVAFRSGPATVFFLWVTMLGSLTVAAGALIASSIVLFLWQKDRYIIPLWVAVCGSQLTGLIGKYELHRARPAGISIYTEQSFSFPSGHSIFAVALYGFLAYIAVRYARRWRNKMYIACAGATIVFLIGLSRLYVGVHYFSDVWGGYLLGFMWLLIGISLSEWMLHKKLRVHPMIARAQSHAGAIAGSIIFAVLFAGYFIAIGHDRIEDILAAPPTFQTSSKTTQNALDIFSDGSPQYTETLLGNRQEPIAFIVTAPSEEAFVRAFTKAGWYPAEQLSSRSIARLGWAALSGVPYPTAPITPSFWNQEVNDFAFEKPTPKDTIKERHHARFWRTPYVTDSGDRVYVGTASLDLRIKWFVTHAISPNIDEERGTLLHDLVDGGTNLSYTSVQFVSPALGKNFTGDAFFTDGKAIVVQIK